MEINEALERVGIKGSPEQLRKSVPLVMKLLNLLGESNNFPVEVHLNNGELDQPQRREKIISILDAVARKSKENNHGIPRIAVHIPFQFQGMPFNLAIHEEKVWENSVEMLKVCLDLIRGIEISTGIETILVAHGYSLGDYEKTEEGLRYINHECSLLRVYRALMEFSENERKKIGIETTGTGPCSAPKDLITLSRSIDCFIIQDVAHLLRKFYIDEANEIHEREYNDLDRLEAAVKQMLPFTKHWHICQHDGGPVNYAGHLADRGILDWSRLIPLMVESFNQNQATATLEVRGLDFKKPIESFGSLLLIRSLIKEYLQKK